MAGSNPVKKCGIDLRNKHINKQVAESQPIYMFVIRKNPNIGEFTYNRLERKYDKPTRRIRTSYNGEVDLPILGDDLITTIIFGGTQIQIAVYDLGGADEDTFSNQYLSNEIAIRNLANKVNKGSFNVASATNEYNASAFYSILKYYEMLNDLFDRVGLTNTKHACVSFTNLNITNAFWTGFCMVFGNGLDSDGKVLPLTSMDVCGHELTHGLQTFTTEFEYQGESGALNESIADVFGTYLEFYVNSSVDTPDWTLGEQFRYIIRDFANPKSRNQPCFYEGEYWGDVNGEDNGGVHTNSGVTNFLCYLAVHGLPRFDSENGKKYSNLIPPESFTFQIYLKAVYLILNENVLTPTSGLKEFANALLSKFSDSNLKHYKLCGEATGLIGNGEEGGEGGEGRHSDPPSPIPPECPQTPRGTPNSDDTCPPTPEIPPDLPPPFPPLPRPPIPTPEPIPSPRYPSSTFGTLKFTVRNRNFFQEEAVAVTPAIRELKIFATPMIPFPFVNYTLNLWFLNPEECMHTVADTRFPDHSGDLYTNSFAFDAPTRVFALITSPALRFSTIFGEYTA